MSGDYIVYILRSTHPLHSTCTYVGCTNNHVRRMRQHNGEIVGGAKYTANKRPLSCICTVHGFVGQRPALKFEWRVKHAPPHGGFSGVQATTVRRRMRMLNGTLGHPEWIDAWTRGELCVRWALPELQEAWDAEVHSSIASALGAV